jgi:hypothetical protein
VQRARELVASIDDRLELRLVEVEGGVPSLELSALECSGWPLAELLLAQAPAELSCVLSLGRTALPLESALAETRSQHGVELSRASVRAGFARGHLLEITLQLPGGTGAEIEQISAENLVRTLLGERLFETWIGAVHVAPAPRGGPLRVLDAHAPRTQLGLAELFDTVAAAVRGVQRGLPELSRVTPAQSASSSEAGAVDQQDWVMLEVEPLPDARDVRKADLVLASTCTPELLRCYLEGAPCSSRRFARGGEWFVFVSYADELASMQERLARRSRVEAELGAALLGMGVVTGVGLGVRTSYVDLALCNLETGLPRLIAKMRSLELPPRSFVQFFDSELSEEWLSISPDSRLVVM